MDKLLIVEDDDSLRSVLGSVLEHSGFAVTAVADVESALTALKTGAFSCILADFKLKGKTGLDLVRQSSELCPSTPFVIMTAYGSIDLAVEAMKIGATDFITKPFQPDVLVELLSGIIERRRVTERGLGSRMRRERQFLTGSPKIERLLAQARKVARVDSSVLILGESGTGKELMARYIHEQSPRAERPFIAINCAALPPDLLESELFGHEAGAYTGATQARAGLFETAAEGTIFLDEVGDMPLPLQVKLLRALQEREIKRLGGSKVIKVNPRIVCATNKSIDILLSSGKMREDFFFRIAVIALTIPPLRERPDDISLLVQHYLELFCAQMGKPLPTINPIARELLMSYAWPGNARELENVMERAVLLTDNEVRPEHLGIDLRIDFSSLDDIRKSLQDVSERAARSAETELIVQTLRRTFGNKSKAAALLGVSYKTLLNKVKLYELGADKEETPVEGSV